MSKRILVIEDDPDILSTVAELLELEGYQVMTASNGKEALQVLADASELPHLIILDYMMPEMNGAEFRLEQEMLPRIASIPVILITADAQPKTRLNEVRAKGYVRKPIDIDQFLNAIETNLE